MVGNQMVNMCGPTFASRLKAAAGSDVGAVVVGFTAAREILGIDGLWDQVGALDNKASAAGRDRALQGPGLRPAQPELLAGPPRRPRQGDRQAVGRSLRAVGRNCSRAWPRPSCRRSSRKRSPSG
ncbi:hypothetical protein ACRAWD_25795 [Caulobacter segnis]